MNASRRRGVAVVLGMIALLVAGSAWSAPIVLPRPGQVGIEVQGGYGTLLKSGTLGGTYGDGGAISARLRYRMRYERALGLSFENERFNIRVPELLAPDGGSGRDRFNLVLSGLEFCKLFATRTPSVKMIIVGAGIAQSRGHFIDGQAYYPGDGTYLSAGAGVERFFFKSWAFDLSARYMFVFLPDDHLHDIQAALGLIFYASY